MIMKRFINKRNLFIAGIVLIAIPGFVWAFTSTDFQNRAFSWTNATCTQKLLNSTNSLSNNKTAALCYSVMKGSENSTSIANLSTKRTQLTLSDANGNQLGPIVDYVVPDGPYTFWSDSINRMVTINGTGQVYNLDSDYRAFFVSSDCTGTPYAVANEYKAAVNELIRVLSPTGNQYFTVDRNQVLSSVQTQSEWGNTSNGVQCISTLNHTLNPAMVLTNSVSLPFSDPVSVPLIIKND